jgi:hypothetical protein
MFQFPDLSVASARSLTDWARRPDRPVTVIADLRASETPHQSPEDSSPDAMPPGLTRAGG